MHDDLMSSMLTGMSCIGFGICLKFLPISRNTQTDRRMHAESKRGAHYVCQPIPRYLCQNNVDVKALSVNKC